MELVLQSCGLEGGWLVVEDIDDVGGAVGQLDVAATDVVDDESADASNHSPRPTIPAVHDEPSIASVCWFRAVEQQSCSLAYDIHSAAMNFARLELGSALIMHSCDQEVCDIRQVGAA